LRSQAASQANAVAEPVSRISSASPVLQRKCACGSSAGAGGSCAECERKAVAVRRSPSNGGLQQRVSRLLTDGLLPATNGTEPVSTSVQNGFGHDFGRVPMLPPELPSEGRDLVRGSSAQQSNDDAGAKAGDIQPDVPQSGEPTAPLETSASGLIAEDDALELAAGQMRKTEFIDDLQRTTCAEADAELAAVGSSTEGCPYIERWMSYYRARSSAQVERALRRYAPEAAGVSNARDYIPIVAARVRRAVTRWATTGEITGVPEELAGQLPGAGVLGAVGSFFSGVAGAVSGALGGVGRALGGIFAKEREGGARDADPQQIQAQLTSGRSLDGGVRSRMESAFNYDFSRVRVHTDAHAAGLSSNVNARAFTIGSDIAFGAGEYQPGTLFGDALLAHELAHVVQQGGSASSPAKMAIGDAAYSSLEEDADKSAVQAVVSMWGKGRGGPKGIGQQAMPRLRSGLGLSRCKADTCSAGNKTITVDFIRMSGATGTPTSDLAAANKIYKPCCVAFTKVADKEVPNDPPDKLSDTWLGGNADLNASGITCSSATAEEKSMYDSATTKYSLSSRMRVFYVQSFSGYDALGFSRPPYCAAGYPNHVVLENGTNDTDLAHEFGHILLNSGDHPPDKSNLMYGKNDRKTNIDDTQCTTIYNNA
jgi:hypothetical protein